MKILPLLEDYEVEYDSEGNPLSPEQTEFFKNSKVRDDKGRLLVCYHGTDNDFLQNASSSVFKKGDGGFHFGDKKTATSRLDFLHGKNKYIKEFYLNIKNPFYINYDCGQWSGSDIALSWLFGTSYDGADEFLNGEQIDLSVNYIPDEFKTDFDKICEIAKLWKTDRNSPMGPGTEQMISLFNAHGYDGIVYINDYESTSDKSYIAFYPNQIKSIYNKNPSNSDNINEETELNEVYPNKGESKKDFIARFMSVTKDEYPDVKQRFAVANSYWDRRNK